MGYRDAQGTSALFNYPEGITYKQSVLYVSDGFNNVIRSVSLTGLASTFAGTGQAGAINTNR